jgi:hypothetical protein
VISLGSAHSDKYLRTAVLNSTVSCFSFEDVPLGAVYWLKSEGVGYQNGAAETRNLTKQAAVWEVVIDVGGGSGNSSSDGRRLLENVVWSWHWELDASRAGWVTESSNSVVPPTITFLDQTVSIADDQAAWKLAHEFGVLLARDSEWSSEFAARLLDTLHTVPLRAGTRSFYKEFDPATLPLRSVWRLEQTEPLYNDIEITTDSLGVRQVRITAATFTHAHPQQVILDGVLGKFFSKRLYHAVVRFVTTNGADYSAVEHIFVSRFGSRTVVSKAMVDQLTFKTTSETSDRFQEWSRHPEQAMLVLSIFEELPSGLHHLPGLSYLLRRTDGLDHPRYPGAPAVAWPDAAGDSYIEFMESAFLSDIRHLRRLVLHEKVHFVWSRLLGDDIKSEWIALGGWFQDEADPDGWSTTKQLQFVSAYAHRKNPNEHLAESVSWYVENPAALQKCCAEQFAFIRDRIMHGHRYIPTLPEDLMFEVFNLAPDYVYPGRIVELRVHVVGAAEDDKKVTVALRLHTAGGVFEGATSAIFRLFSTIGTFQDVWMRATTVDGDRLEATFTMSKYAKSGYWVTDQIELRDITGNQRFSGMADFGWKMLLDSPLEDIAKPSYVPGSLSLTARQDVRGGQEVQILSASWLLIEDNAMLQWGGVYVRLASTVGTRSLQEYGYPGLSPAGPSDDCGTVPQGYKCERATVELIFTRFRQSGEYWVSQLNMLDVSLNAVSQYFTDSGRDEPRIIVPLSFSDPDTTPPTLDLDAITIRAEPTNPEAPNGETKVTIHYFAQDDKSGLGIVSYRLMDPVGGSHFEYHYHKNFYTLFFNGNVTAKTLYTIEVVLPVGSPPGMWGLESMELSDKVDNLYAASFAELMHFKEGVRSKRGKSRFSFQVIGSSDTVRGSLFSQRIMSGGDREGGGRGWGGVHGVGEQTRRHTHLTNSTNVPTSAYGVRQAGECAATDVANIAPCQAKLSAPTDTDATKWCTYLKEYIECIPSSTSPPLRAVVHVCARAHCVASALASSECGAPAPACRAADWVWRVRQRTAARTPPPRRPWTR